MPHSKKFSNNFDGKTIHTFWEYFIFVCQAIQKCILVLQFMKFPSVNLLHVHITVRRVLPWPKFANQGEQNLRDGHGSFAKVSLSRKPYSSICTLLKVSSFSPANFTDHHFTYYLTLEKNKRALERKMNHSLSFLISSIGCCHEIHIIANKSIRYFAIVAPWH